MNAMELLTTRRTYRRFAPQEDSRTACTISSTTSCGTAFCANRR